MPMQLARIKPVPRALQKLIDDPLSAAVKRLRYLFDNQKSEHHEIGTLYNRIVDGRLAENAGYRYSRELFAKEFKDVAQSTLSLYGGVAKTFTEPITKRYGVACLGKLITYSNTAKQSLPDGDPGDIKIEVPQRDGSVVAKQFADCSSSELSRAIKQLEGPPPALPPPDAKVVGQLHDVLLAALGGNTGLALKATHAKDKTRVVLAVDLTELSLVGEALRQVFPSHPADGLAKPARAPRRSPKRR